MRKVLNPAEREEFDSWGLEAQRFSENAKRRLYLFIKTGNNNHGQEERSRLELAREAIKSWVSKTVRRKGDSRSGVVEYLLFRTKSELRLLRVSHRAVQQETNAPPAQLGAFELMIRWHDANATTANSPSSVEVVIGVEE